MNILMISDVYFPRVNGVSTSMQTFCRELVGRGHAVTIVAPDYGVAEGETEFEMIRLPSRRIFFDPEDRLIKKSAARSVVQELARRSWDVIHMHTPFRAHQIGVELARMTGRPTVESYHTYFEEYIANYLPWFPPPLLRFFVRRFSRSLCGNIDHMIVPTTEMADVLRGYGIETPSTVIPTGIRLDEFANGDGARFRRQHGVGETQPMLLTVSRLALEKNIDFLLEAARVLKAEFDDFVFVIAGEGPDATRLQRLTRSLGLDRHVRFLGNLDRRTTLLDCYSAADVFMFASSTETQGLVLIEAMACGAPIVSTAVMGTATVLRDTRSALISTGDVNEFASLVARLLRSPDERRALSAAGPHDAARWSAPVLMQKVIAMYETLARNDRSNAVSDVSVGRRDQARSTI
jgi:glycosyltransferase involved in cell wall biosynthesis